MAASKNAVPVIITHPDANDQRSLCERCSGDQEFIRRKIRPNVARDGAALRVVDLFSGCGAMSVGLDEAARINGVRLEIALALDIDPDALKILATNFPNALRHCANVSEVLDGDVGAPLSVSERKLRRSAGRCDILLGGPPCQGHSDLNNHTRRSDPRNDLYFKMARAAEVFKPKVVVIENVPPVQWDKSDVVARTRSALEMAGYDVSTGVVDLLKLGVPQRRRRFLLVASRAKRLNPRAILDELGNPICQHTRSVRWAIGDIEDPEAATTYDTASTATDENLKRIEYLFEHKVFDLPNAQRPSCHRDGGHSYKSMYGRLQWEKPAQTITTGYGSMGQGRYVHPSARRTITPHEAARLQTFPDWFDFGKDARRGVMAKVIGNAVAPLLMAQLGARLVPGLLNAKEARPSASSAVATKRMKSTRQRDTKAELRLRRELFSMGLRYYVDRKVQAGVRTRADLVFSRARVAVFVDGCFWHCCPEHGSQPKANALWWSKKLSDNQRRDADAGIRLGKGGWEVIRIWEHEDPVVAAASIAKCVRSRLASRHGGATHNPNGASDLAEGVVAVRHERRRQP